MKYILPHARELWAGGSVTRQIYLQNAGESMSKNQRRRSNFTDEAMLRRDMMLLQIDKIVLEYENWLLKYIGKQLGVPMTKEEDLK